MIELFMIVLPWSENITRAVFEDFLDQMEGRYLVAVVVVQ